MILESSSQYKKIFVYLLAAVKVIKKISISVLPCKKPK
jgi:hypothetical protein